MCDMCSVEISTRQLWNFCLNYAILGITKSNSKLEDICRRFVSSENEIIDIVNGKVAKLSRMDVNPLTEIFC